MTKRHKKPGGYRCCHSRLMGRAKIPGLKLITVQEYAKEAHLSEGAVIKRIWRGVLPAWRFSGRWYVASLRNITSKGSN